MATEPIVVAIDGPSGVGKSTVARRLASRLAIPFLDTGAMYRAIALKVLDSGVDPHDRAEVERLVRETAVGLERRPDGSFDVLLDGAPVESRIRTPEVGAASSVVSAHTGVRQRLVALQHDAARHFGGVLEGRDIGTRVFPETPYKFFLDARSEVRFKRRHDELQATGREVPLEEVVEEITERDHRDTTRADSPLTRDASYTFVDASDLSVEEVVERMAGVIEGRSATPSARAATSP
jgi:cytidylate kinase